MCFLVVFSSMNQSKCGGQPRNCYDFLEDLESVYLITHVISKKYDEGPRLVVVKNGNGKFLWFLDLDSGIQYLTPSKMCQELMPRSGKTNQWRGTINVYVLREDKPRSLLELMGN
jgi:hypothetical protein